MLMYYTITAEVCFDIQYDGLFKKDKCYQAFANTSVRSMAHDIRDVLDKLYAKADKKCNDAMENKSFSFPLSDCFSGDWCIDIDHVNYVGYEVIQHSFKVEDPRNWTIDKVLERCTASEAFEIFGQNFVDLFAIFKKR